MLLCCEIDVQIGNGRLNYISGYVSKDHDAVDVGLGEYVQKNSTSFARRVSTLEQEQPLSS